MRWTGPLPSDFLNGSGDLLARPVPPERWPYGPPEAHEDCCILFVFERVYLEGADVFCDCAASAADEEDPYR